MHKIIRDKIRKQTFDFSEIQDELARLGYKISEDNLVEIAKKIVCGYVTVEGEPFNVPVFREINCEIIILKFLKRIQKNVKRIKRMNELKPMFVSTRDFSFSFFNLYLCYICIYISSLT